MPTTAIAQVTPMYGERVGTGLLVPVFEVWVDDIATVALLPPAA